MKILYLTQVFEVENDNGSDRHYFTCKKMSESGFDVHVLTSNIDYKTSKMKHEGHIFRNKIISKNCIKIHYVYSLPNFKNNRIKRILYYSSYFISSIITARKIKNIDIVYAVSSPLTVGILGLLISTVLRAKFVFEVTDVWPDVLIKMGVLKNRIIINIMKFFEIKCYKKAEFIVALSKGIRENIQKKTTNNEIILIPNGVDEKLFKVTSDSIDKIESLKDKYNLKGKFNILYLGAHGKYNSLFTIIETAKILKNINNIIFTFIGDGDVKPKLKKLCTEYSLKNIIFLDPVPRKEAPIYLQLGDAFILASLKGEFYKMNLQNKFFDYLISGKPIIYSGSGEQAEIIDIANCGIHVASENPVLLSDAILKLSNTIKENLDLMGRNGRKYVLNFFERSKLTQVLLDRIENL